MRCSTMVRKFLIGILLPVAVLTIGIGTVRAQYNPQYFFWVGRNCMINNDYREAIRTLNTLLRHDEDAFEGYFLRGIAKYNLNDLLGAEADFSTAIEKNPVYTTAYTYRAITRSRLGNYDDALNDFREAIELRPDLPNPYYSRGVTRLLNQQFKEAISDFDHFIRQENKVADAYINRGMSYLYLKDTVRAYEDFSTAIRTNRENPDSYNRRGALYMKQKHYDEAEADFDKAISCDSTYLLSFFNRALLYSDTHRPMRALDDFDRVIELDSTNSLTYYNRAILRTQIGDYNRALEDYDRVALYSPQNVLVYYNRAALYTFLGDYTAAVRDYDRAIELYPDFANAYLNRADLRFLLRDDKGAKADRETAQRKIAAYKSRLADSTYSIYADTTQRFDRLLSFESKMPGSDFTRISTRSDDGELRLIPLFKFTLTEPDSAMMALRRIYRPRRAEDFLRKVGAKHLALASGETTLPADTLVLLDEHYARRIRENNATWVDLFMRGITQSLVKQYTNSVGTLSQAIDLNPANPFLYINRSTIRAEMIDFISSIDNSYQRVTIDSDPAKRLHNQARTYSYDEAIEDLNKAAKLYPDYAYTYYNRACLEALSGKLPEAYDDFTRAIELNPSLAEAYYNRGLVQIFMKDTRKGCLDLSKSGELGIRQAYEVLRRYAHAQND